MFIYDVFLSYSQDSRCEALALAEALRGRGLRPWLDVCDLAPGLPWQVEVEKVIAATPAAAVLVGQSGLGPWQARESAAVLEEFVGRGARVIPVLLPSAPGEPRFPLFLRGFTFVDLRGVDLAGGLAGQPELDRLVWGITGRKPEPPAPAAAGTAAAWQHNLPWNPLGLLFKGRAAALAELADGFAAAPGTGFAGGRAQVICGLGGVGKTRLAIEYGWQAGSRYHHTFFIGGATADSLRRGLAELAEPRWLDLGLAGAGEGEKFGAVVVWLERHPGWLLICDNVDTVESQQALRGLLPLHGGHLLVTSRLASWPAELRRMKLGTLERKDAVALLLAATGKGASDDAALADALAERLGDLPLALEQAAAYLEERGSDFAAYLEDWRLDRERLLGWYDPGATNYPLAVAWTFSHSVERLGRWPRTLLRLLSHYGDDPIPLAMLKAGAAILGEAAELLGAPDARPDERLDLCGAVAELARYSLVTRQAGAIRVHRLVQEVERASIEAARRKAWLEKALRMINHFAPRPPDDARNWAAWDELRPHAERAIELACREGVGEPTAELMIELGILLSGKGLYDQAESLLRRALLFDEARLGAQNPRIAVDLGNLAQVLLATGRRADAESFMRRALEIDESAYGADHPNAARHLNNLAALLQATGRYAEAEPLMRRALRIDEQAYGPHHAKVAIRLNNLAMLLEATARLEEAEPLARRALRITEEALGPDHPRVASRLVNLGRLLQAKNRLDEAEALVQRALAIDEAFFGTEHPTVARDRFALASLARSRGALGEAASLCWQAVEICSASLGADDERTRYLRSQLREIAENSTTF